jgi:uncharacterized protein (DUF1684 family)
VVSGLYAASLVLWREAVADIYRDVRATHARDPREAWRRFRRGRDALYKTHACSALTQAEKQRFEGFAYYDYEPQLCFVGEVDYTAPEAPYALNISEGVMSYRRIGTVRFTRLGVAHALDLFWLDIYGGGLWLPVADETNGETSYGGGRYLFDTTKGANLGLSADGKSLRLDLNFLYPPSCALNSAWICPLCPPQNKLAFKAEAGERSGLVAEASSP